MNMVNMNNRQINKKSHNTQHKKAVWLTKKEGEPTKLFYCSECGGLIELSRYAYKCYYNYCPTCGAEMNRYENNDET